MTIKKVFKPEFKLYFNLKYNLKIKNSFIYIYIFNQRYLFSFP